MCCIGRPVCTFPQPPENVSSVTEASFVRLTLGRACAWFLLVSGWIGVGGLALQFTSSSAGAFALVSLWLIVLGAAATVGTGAAIHRGLRVLALASAAVVASAGLFWSIRGGGLLAVLLVVLAWGAVTALASGVVRSLRLARRSQPQPPVLAAALGGISAGWMLGDPGDLARMSEHMAIFVLIMATILACLQFQTADRQGAPGCRAGLFDCSLPAWPAGAWRDLGQWPLLLSGLVMLPMMAALPLMADWCRAQSLTPQVLVLLHLSAMFGSALLLRPWIAVWTTPVLSTLCMALLVTGAVLAMWLASPWDMLGLALTHGSAWGLAWSGQLWGPTRRGQQNASPLRAALGYAGLTFVFGLWVDRFGPAGVNSVHILIGALALLAWLLKDLFRPSKLGDGSSKLSN